MPKKIKPKKIRRRFSFECRENEEVWQVRVVCREGLSETYETEWFGKYDSEEKAAHAGEHMVEELQNGDDYGLNEMGVR